MEYIRYWMALDRLGGGPRDHPVTVFLYYSIYGEKALYFHPADVVVFVIMLARRLSRRSATVDRCYTAK
jgi:hypothetical protein